ncbi:MAG: pseudaminic acid biosynthesis-associated methylase [Kofleriaceae bacterium]
MTKQEPEARRLEDLWGGEFGDEYVDRNIDAAKVREPFWAALLDEIAVSRVLEVGCNVGANLTWIAKRVPEDGVYGIDINRKALARLRAQIPTVNALHSPARNLPFRDAFFDLTFTMGVLIHQPPETLPLVMNEIVRCSRRYVLCGEYASDKPTEVAYRGQTGALFKRDFGGYYEQLFPELRRIKSGFLGKDQGWDDVTYWLFEKT